MTIDEMETAARHLWTDFPKQSLKRLRNVQGGFLVFGADGPLIPLRYLAFKQDGGDPAEATTPFRTETEDALQATLEQAGCGPIHVGHPRFEVMVERFHTAYLDPDNLNPTNRPTENQTEARLNTVRSRRRRYWFYEIAANSRSSADNAGAPVPAATAASGGGQLPQDYDSPSDAHLLHPKTQGLPSALTPEELAQRPVHLKDVKVQMSSNLRGHDGSTRDALVEPQGNYTHDLNRDVSESLKGSREARLARLARLAQAPRQPERVQSMVETFRRNADVIAEALHRANGKCQECHAAAPFPRRSDGTPYLEVHHVVPLADNGEDTLDNVRTLCPNCHRKAHFG